MVIVCSLTCLHAGARRRAVISSRSFPAKNRTDVLERSELPAWLHQSEVAGDEKHHYNHTDDVKNTGHFTCSFHSRDRLTVRPTTRSNARREMGREESLVLSSDEASWDLDFSDNIRIGLLHPVDAFKPLL